MDNIITNLIALAVGTIVFAICSIPIWLYKDATTNITKHIPITSEKASNITFLWFFIAIIPGTLMRLFIYKLFKMPDTCYDTFILMLVIFSVINYFILKHGFDEHLYMRAKSYRLEQDFFDFLKILNKNADVIKFEGANILEREQSSKELIDFHYKIFLSVYKDIDTNNEALDDIWSIESQLFNMQEAINQGNYVERMNFYSKQQIK